MNAISIHQPFAWMIVNGKKMIENRTWPTHHRGPLLIHAAKTTDTLYDKTLEEWRELYPWYPEDDETLPRGCIVGVVNVVDCLPKQDCNSPWAFGPWCYVLADARALKEPISYRGQQRLFQIPDHVIHGQSFL